MEDNNPYKRRYKTKNEQYQEKLKQRSNSQEWLFGNMFGKPGGGAPLRDSKGNIISHLKTINNDNIFKYDPNVFTRGNNNISSQNINNNAQRNLILTPNSYTNNQINSFIPNNQSFLFQDNNKSNNIFLQNNIQQKNNNNPILLNQKQLPLVYIIPIQNIIPANQTYPRQINNNNIQNYYNPMISTPLINNRMNIATPPINYTNKSQNIIKENINNISKEELKNDYSVDMNNNIDQSKDNLFISNDNDNNIKLRNEQKLEEWKRDLKKQMEEQKRKKEEAKRKEIEDDKEEERKYQEFLQYKSQQAEENKRIKSKLKKNRNQQSQNQSNIELEKTNNNINNDIFEKSQPKIENIRNYEIEEEPYNPNNPLNAYNITPQMLKEQEDLKKYIDNQYNTLGDTLAQNIQNEVENLASNLTKKYNNFSNKDDLELQGINKFNEMTVERNNKRVEHLHDIIEERELLNFIIGRDENTEPTMKYQNYDISKYNNLNSKMPSYFGKNVMSYENESKQLNSKGKFIYGDFSTNRKEIGNENKSSNQELEFKANKYDNSYLNNTNNISKKFGKNKNENMISQSLEFSQSLDNKTSFIPLDKKEQKSKDDSTPMNIKNDNFDINHKKYLDVIPDIIEDNIIKNLNEIDELNKNVILYKKEGNMILDNNNDNNKNNNDDIKEIINIDKSNINNDNLDLKNEEN